jgi:hypothetical protein
LGLGRIEPTILADAETTEAIREAIAFASPPAAPAADAVGAGNARCSAGSARQWTTKVAVMTDLRPVAGGSLGKRGQPVVATIVSTLGAIVSNR